MWTDLEHIARWRLDVGAHSYEWFHGGSYVRSNVLWRWRGRFLRVTRAADVRGSSGLVVRRLRRNAAALFALP